MLSMTLTPSLFVSLPADPALLPPNQQSRVVGTVSLSLSPATRDRFNTLQPEDTCCYLSNMAVDGKLRRYADLPPFGFCSHFVRVGEALIAALSLLALDQAHGTLRCNFTELLLFYFPDLKKK
jgi:hypothetical protein